MGVDGFWPIVSSKGKQVTIDILSDKIIAVDASIWIYQFANALRDSTGDPVKASHIVGFFKRICKLLFLRIKPVFVFDGPPIALKFAALRKRRDDSIPDSVFRKAAQQILMQNLQVLRANPHKVFAPKPGLPPVSESDDSIDEIHILTDSSSDEDGVSPSRRLRLSVPEEFRGFMSERRSLDCVSLPISPEKVRVPHQARKEVDIDASIDAEFLKDLPLHEQYRGLLQTRSALLSQGRRKALQLASQIGSAASHPDLDMLSRDQIKAVVDLAKVTDMTKAVRLQMSREENKDEVYVPPEGVNGQRAASSSSTTGLPATKRRRHKFGQDQYMFDGMSDKHSVLVSARTVGRNDLLFSKSTVQKDEHEVQPVKEEAKAVSSEDDEDEDELKLKLFGNEWSDLIGKAEPAQSRPVPVTQSALTPTPASEIRTRMAVEPPRSPSAHSSSTSSEDAAVMSQSESESEESVPEMVPVLSAAAAAAAPATMEPVDETSESESPDHDESSGSSEEEIDIESQDEEAPLRMEDESAAPVAHAVPTLESISDEELNVFAALRDPFPSFANSVEEDAFQDKVRARISMSDSMDDRTAYTEIQELLTGFGIPWVSAPADAEAQCAFLCQAGLVDGVISDDSDTLIYGSPVVFRHLYLGDSTVEIFKLNSLGFSQPELISMALLLGCDFTEGVRGIGPVNATEIVRHYSGLVGLARLREWADRCASDGGRETDVVYGEDDSDGELKEFKLKHANYRAQWVFPDDFPSAEVWNLFETPPVSRDMEPFSWVVPDEREVADVVLRHTDMSRDMVESILSTTMGRYHETQIQRRITDYFSPAFERGSVAEVVSKRLKAALAKSSFIHS